MAYGAIARGIGQVLGKGFLRNLGGKKAVKEITQEALMSGGLNFGLQTGTQLLSGQPVDIMGNLAYAGADVLASGGAIAGVRGLRPKGTRRVVVKGPDGKDIVQRERIRSKLEGPANFAASVASTVPVTMLLGNQGVVQQNPQTVQVAQQNAQRAAVNLDPNLLAGAYMPGTMMQNVGAPSSSAMYQQMLNDMGQGVANDPTFNANAMAIMGLQ